MRSNPPPNWQPLVEPATESRRRKWVLGLTALAAVLGGGVVAAFIGITVFTLNEVPDGYSSSDVCWSIDGEESAEGEPLLQTPCSLEHDYVSGESVSTQEQCPVNAAGFVEENGQVTCLEEPR